jgi:DNA-binding response OmpR family regulator
MHILLVEDDHDLAANIVDYLDNQGHETDWFGRVAGVIAASQNPALDVIVMDLMLPDGNGLELARQIREQVDGDIPILMLTARDSEQDKLDGFAAGTDDYLVKPFSLAELSVRLVALHRRSHGARISNLLSVADLTLDRHTRHLSRNGLEIKLKPATLKVAEYLMANTHRTVPSQELLNAIWGEDAPGKDALRVHIHSLRKAVEREGFPALVHTYRGTGYRVTEL